ncbi:hypothetical protein FLK61_27635 [Paenalkalicoccus suaedae]|uniref:Uncharacterized protein n=1 Tax=Paenalkalicoccus suaedae TaxID=2592382 RepID=A0A859FE79_9BACI|nr:hypothetical protein [Paenalkalicoccus suaedae]QKS70526.1 hypothetical protein FLK61_27635 [Paenalkalicoccus suaedae]
MFDRKIRAVKKKARRYKRSFEKIDVFPRPWIEHDKSYYLVDYVRLRKPIGSALFSDEEEVVVEAKAAYKGLYLFNRLAEKIQQDGHMRAQIDVTYFRAPLKMIDKHPHEDLAEGRALIESLLAYQLKYRETYRTFFASLKERAEAKKPISEKDIEEAVHTAALLDVLQYVMIKEIADNTKKIERFIEQMKKHELWESITKGQRVFYTQLIENETIMKEELSNMQIVKHENHEKMLKLNKEKLQYYKQKECKHAEKALRYQL